MAVDTPVLENSLEDLRRTQRCATRSYFDCFEEEEAHNARIRDNYARLIDPDCKIEDVFRAVPVQAESVAAPVNTIAEAPVRAERPYLVENARADASIFRADHPVNHTTAAAENVASSAVAPSTPDEEDEDLRPTPTTIQYQTVAEGRGSIRATSDKRERILGKREKIIIAVFVGVVIALIALVIVNSTIIANLNADISYVQNEIATVRGALAGVNSSISEIIPDSVRNLIIK